MCIYESPTIPNFAPISMVCVPHSYVLQSSAIYITFKQKYAYRIDMEFKYMIKLIFHYLNQNSMAETMKDRN